MRKGLRATSLLLSSLLMFNTVVASPIAVFAHGEETHEYDAVTRATENGTEQIEIDTPEEFVELSENFGSEEYPSNAIYELTADLDMEGYNFTMMGNSSPNTRYSGIFAGHDHKISNLTIAPTSGDAAMFHSIGDNGIVEDIIFENPTVIGTGSAGVIAVENRGEIKNCYVINGDIQGSSSVGGLVGSQNDYSGESVIKKSYVDSDTTVKATSAGAGGLVGYASGTSIVQSYSEATVTGTGSVGGLVGDATDTDFTNCYSTGKVTATGSSGGAGGIVGTLSYGGGDYTNLYSTAEVVANASGGYAGGLIGKINFNNSVGVDIDTMTNCYAINKSISGKKAGYVVSEAHTYTNDVAAPYNFDTAYWDNMPVTATIINDIGAEKTQTALSTKETYTGWDFSTIWEWVTTEEGSYPKLKGIDGQEYNYPFTNVINPVVVTPTSETTWKKEIDVDLTFPIGVSSKKYMVSTSDQKPDASDPKWVSVADNTYNVKVELDKIPSIASGEYYIHWKTSEGDSGQTTPNGPYKLDITKPTVTATFAPDTNKITVHMNGTDEHSGVTHYGTTEKATFTDSMWKTTNVQTITGLLPFKSYPIKVKVKDAAGNIGEITVNVSTIKNDQVSIAFAPDGNTEWKNSIPVTAYYSANGKDKEYLLIDSTAIIPAKTDPAWTQVPLATMSVNVDLKDLITYGETAPTSGKKKLVGYSVYDATKNKTQFSKEYLLDIDEPVFEDPKYTDVTTETSIDFTVNASDVHSGIDKYAVWLSSDTFSDGMWQDSATVALEGLTPGTQYTVNFKVKDKAGNETDVQSAVITTPGGDIDWSVTATPEKAEVWAKDISVELGFTAGMTNKAYAVSDQNIAVPTEGWVAVADTENLATIALEDYDSGEKYIYWKGECNGDVLLPEVPFGVYMLDKTAPSGLSVVGQTEGNKVTVSVLGDDEHSQIAQYAILSDGQSLSDDQWQSGNSEVFEALTLGQIYTFTAYAKDNAGNVSAPATYTVTIGNGGNGGNGGDGNDDGDGEDSNSSSGSSGSSGGSGSYSPPPAENTQSEANQNFVEIDENITPLGAIEPKEASTSYVTGYEDGSFKPQGQLTRAEFAVMLYSLTPVKAPVVLDQSFTDIKGDEWYADEVLLLNSMGVLSGYEDGSFRANEPITRAEIVTALSKFGDVAPVSKEVFPDVSAEHWANAYISAFYEKGFVQGYPDGTFGPDKPVTRAEAVVMINNVMGIEIATDVDTKPNPFNDLTKEHFAYKDIITVVE